MGLLFPAHFDKDWVDEGYGAMLILSDERVRR